MNAIWKYPLSWLGWGEFKIMMPKGAKLLTVMAQDGVPMLWALVDVHESHVPRSISIVGTGHIFVAGIHVASLQSGQFVWHLLDLGEEAS